MGPKRKLYIVAEEAEEVEQKSEKRRRLDDIDLDSKLPIDSHFVPVGSCPSYEINKFGQIRLIGKTTFLKHKSTSGYRSVGLKAKNYLVHRLVALAFVENPDPINYDRVNHKNSDRRDCRSSNLEWTNASGNSRHYEATRTKPPKACPVIQIDPKTDKIIGEFSSVAEAAKSVQVHQTKIYEVLEGKHVTSGGFKWKKQNEEKKAEVIVGEKWLVVTVDKKGTNYEISDVGRVRNIKRNAVLKPSLTREGYMVAKLCIEKKERNFFVHRLVAEAFLSKPDGANVVNHKDRNRANNNESNLEWVTTQQNMVHALGQPVNKIDPRTMEIVGSFNSLVEAANSISVTLRKFNWDMKKGNSCGGFLWKPK